MTAKMSLFSIVKMKYGLLAALMAAAVISAVFPAQSLADSQAAFNVVFGGTNYSADPGCSTCWSSSVGGVQPGNIINVRFIYQNTSDATALNTRAQIQISNNGGTDVTVTGSMFASNASIVSRTVAIHGTQPITLAYQSSYVFKDGNTFNGVPIAGGEGIMSSGGANIGDIPAGSSHLGFVLVTLTISGGTAVTPTPSPSMGSPWGSIFASPNPCQAESGGTCATFITWSASNVSQARVYVATNGVETLFVTNPSCSGSNCPADFIQAGHTYVFSLYDYSSGSRGQLLGSVPVSATGAVVAPPSPPPGPSPSGTIFASPNPCTVSAGSNTCASFITWNTTNVTRAEVFVVTNGVETLFVNSTSCSGNNCPASFIQPGHTYVFSLYDYSSGSRGQLLGSVPVSAFPPATVTPPPATNPPTSNPSSVSTVNLSINRTGFLVTDQWTLSINSNIPNQQVFICGTQTPTNGQTQRTTCTPAQNLGLAATTDANGNWTGSNSFNNSSLGYWQEWAFVGGTIVAEGVVSGGTRSGNNVFFTVSPVTPSGGAPIAQTLAASGIAQNSAVLNATVNPNNSLTTYHFEYGTTASLGNSTPSQTVAAGNSDQSVSAQIFNLNSNTAYFFRIVATNSFGASQGSILSFVTTFTQSGGAPIVATLAANSIAQNSAVLNATVNPNGSAATYYFEYGTTASLGNSTPSQTVAALTSAQSVFAQISNLVPNAAYFYRISAANGFGTSVGQVLSFTTVGAGQAGSVPIVQTLSSNVSQNSATLNGQVNPNGSQTSYYFEYGQTPSFGFTTGFQSAGSGNSPLSVSASVSGLNPNTTYYYRVDAANSFGTTSGNTLSFVTSGFGGGGFSGNAPSVQTQSANANDTNSATLNGQANPNGADTQAWFEYGINPSFLSFTTGITNVGSGNSFINFTQFVSGLSPGTTYYYRAAARNAYGTNWGQALSFTTSGSGGGFYGGIGYSQVPSVITGPAQLVSRNSALLNGQVNPQGGLTVAWFDYGPTLNLGLQTAPQPLGSANGLLSYSFAVSGLLPNTIYYYRAAAQNQFGAARGTILSFQTIGGVVAAPPSGGGTIVRTVTVPGQALSCITLVPSINSPQLGAGQDFTYTVTYRNGCSFDITNTVVKAILPIEVDFKSSSNPSFTISGNTLTYTVGTVPQDVESSINIRGTVKSDVAAGDNLIFTSILTFTDNRGGFQSLTAYLTAFVTTGAAGSVLGASLLSTLQNLFGNWLFWIILILAIMVLIIWLALRSGRDEAPDIKNIRVT